MMMLTCNTGSREAGTENPKFEANLCYILHKATLSKEKSKETKEEKEASGE